MNCNNGQIYDLNGISAKEFADQFYIGAAQKKSNPFIEMKVAPTEEQLKRNPPKVGRNEMCPCGSGKKFKKCHLIS